jgi:uncharacterized protein YdhG (YjbR/CyaY superfamily)
MTAQEIDEYLAALDQAKRDTLSTLRAQILKVIPDAEQVLSHNAPCFKIKGKAVAGFGAFKSHVVYATWGKNVTEVLASELAGYVVSKASFQIQIGDKLPDQLVEKLIAARLAEIG